MKSLKLITLFLACLLFCGCGDTPEIIEISQTSVYNESSDSAIQSSDYVESSEPVVNSNSLNSPDSVVSSDCRHGIFIDRNCILFC